MLLQETHSTTEQSGHSSGTWETKGQVLVPQNLKIFLQRIKFILDKQQYRSVSGT